MAKRPKEEHTLPREEWWCIWCDKRPEDGRKFGKREHVIAESLGGHRDHRLLRGMVCDQCNSGVLHQLDDQAVLHPLVGQVRSFFAVGPSKTTQRKAGRGVTFDPQGLEGVIDMMRMRPEDRAAATPRLTAEGIAFTTTVVSEKKDASALNVSLGRNFHRAAYNALAEKMGHAVRGPYGHLREYVLDENARPRACLVELEPLGDAWSRLGTRATASPPSSAEFILDPRRRRPAIVRLMIGPLHVLVSVEPSLLKLRQLAARSDVPRHPILGWLTA